MTIAHYPEVCFIFSTQRSGTTVLNGILAQHPALNCYDEIFSPRIKYESSTYFDDYYVWDSLIDGCDVGRCHATILKFLKYLAGRRHGKLCFKLMVDQYMDLRMGPVLDCLPNIKIIKLIRNNPLEVLVSRIRSEQNNLVHVYEAVDSSDRKTYLNPGSILTFLDDVMLGNKIISDEFSARSADTLNLTYDQVLNDLWGLPSKIYRFLGVDESFMPDIILKKIGSHNVWDDISNAEEIAAVLRGSRYNSLVTPEL